MITSAAVKIWDNKQHKEIIIPCHRHGDAFQILYDFGYKKQDFRELEQGFLTEKDIFLNRIDAKLEAIKYNQIKNASSLSYKSLYSEDLW